MATYTAPTNNTELSDEDISNMLVPIENDGATVKDLPFVPTDNKNIVSENNVNEITSPVTNNVNNITDEDISNMLIPMGTDYNSGLEHEVLNPNGKPLERGPDDEPVIGEIRTGHTLYTKQYLENMFPDINNRPFEFTQENIEQLNTELLRSSKNDLNTGWTISQLRGGVPANKLLNKLKRMDPEVDYSREAPSGLRNKLVGMDTTEEKKNAINEYFGNPDAAGTDKRGDLTFINPDTGHKTIVDKPELTMRDWIDLRDDYPLLTATLFGAWKLRLLGWGAQALGDTAIYMSGRTLTEAIEEWSGRNKETYEDVQNRLVQESFLVLGLNAVVGTTVWGVNRMKNPIHTGVTPDSELAVKEMLRINERRVKAGLPPVQLLASALNDNPMLARIEGILSKIPVSAQIYKVKQESIDKMIADEVEFLIKDLNITGPARNAEIQRLTKNFKTIVDEHLDFIYSKHNARFTGINPATGKKTATEGTEIAFEKQTLLFEKDYAALGTISGDSKWIHLGMSTGGKGKPSAFKQELQKEVENLKDVPILDPLRSTLEKILKTGDEAGGWVNVAQYVNVKKELAKRMKGTSTHLRDLDTGRAAKLYELLEKAVDQASKNPSRIKDKFPPGTDVGKFIKQFKDTNRRYKEYKDLYITGKGTVAEITRANAKGDDAFNLIDFFFRKDNSKNVTEMKSVLLSIPGGAKQWKTMQGAIKDILIGTKGGALRTPKELDKILDDIGEETITAWLGPKAFRNYKDLAKAARQFGEKNAVKLVKEADDAKHLFHSLIKDKNINTIIQARELVGAGSKEWKTAQKHYVGELLDAASDNGILNGQKLQNILKGAEGGFNQNFINEMFKGSPYLQRLADLADISARSARAKSSMAGGLAAGMVVLSFLTMKLGAFVKAATFGWINASFLTQKSLAAAWFTNKKFHDITDTQLRAMLREWSRFGDQEQLTTWETQEQKELKKLLDAQKGNIKKKK